MVEALQLGLDLYEGKARAVIGLCCSSCSSTCVTPEDKPIPLLVIQVFPSKVHHLHCYVKWTALSYSIRKAIRARIFSYAVTGWANFE